MSDYIFGEFKSATIPYKLNPLPEKKDFHQYDNLKQYIRTTHPLHNFIEFYQSSLHDPIFYELFLETQSFRLSDEFSLLVSPNDLSQKLIADSIIKKNLKKEAVFSTHIETRVEDTSENPPLSVGALNLKNAFTYIMQNIRDPLTENKIKTINNIIRYNRDSQAEFRNGIATIKNGSTTIFTPIEPQEIIPCMSSFLNFFNDDDPSIDPYFKAMLIYFYFESMHPFADGNGRTGRLLISLFLMKFIKKPVPILLSELLYQNDKEHYQSLQNFNKNNDTKEPYDFMSTIMHESIKNLIVQYRYTNKEISKVALRLFSKQSLEPFRIFHIILGFDSLSIEELGEKIQCSRKTLEKHLKILLDENYIVQKKEGKSFIYSINEELFLK